MVIKNSKFLLQQTHHAFTMLELVFAIVIIGIAVLALPTVLLTSASSQEQTLKEEGIMLTTTKISQILTFPWDQNSSPTAVMSTSQVLNTAGDADLNRNGTTDFRIGHFPDELRRRMSPNSAQRSAGAIGGVNNIGSFNGEAVTVGAAGSDQGYKKQYRTTTLVRYVADAADYNIAADTNLIFNFTTADPGTTTNIKMIQVSTSEMDPAGAWVPIIQMTAYSANIGEAEFFKRRY